MPFTPHDAGTHAIRRARRLLRESAPAVKHPIELRTDMRRLSVVMAVAALDAYMHRLVVDRAYTHDELPKPLARLDVPFALLLEQADDTKAAARAKPRDSRPRVGVKRTLRDRLLKQTFQRFDDVGTALSMSGRPGSWVAIGRQFTPPQTPEQL